MAHLDARGSAERPLQGAVLCFTSVGPDERTRIAELATQMGAEHKLDLTSDTTHLIVGSTDTLKYQYVAREREDIKVLRPEWVEAVREYWIKDQPVDLAALAREYRMPTLAGLKLCITGFDDLSFRAQLQRNVVENGGEYTGDLTKDVTHLIAAKPEGKKYEYGLQWQKKVVSLSWYKDTLERGMQLDERLYHPTVPVAEQGRGAWNRRPPPSPRPVKRPREDNSVTEPARKLRRTASARLGSQSQNMWTDIVGGAGFEADQVERPPLNHSVSMPSLRKANGAVRQPHNGQIAVTGDPAPANIPHSGAAFLAGRHFIIKGFDGRKEGLLRQILLENGGTILEGGEDQEQGQMGNTLWILPHDLRRDANSTATLPNSRFEAVSELWLERCMLEKAFLEPRNYPLGQWIKGPCWNELSQVAVNATGFNALETLHISKMVTLLGGKYSQVFTSTVSVLVCKTGSSNKPKLELAHRSGIPAVSEEWLWATMRDCKKAPLEHYLVQQHPAHLVDAKFDEHRSKPVEYVEVSTIPLQPEDRERRSRRQSTTHSDREESRNDARGGGKRKKSLVQVHQEPTGDAAPGEHGQPSNSPHMSEPSAHSETQAASPVPVDLPLQEVSSNSSGSLHRSLKSKKHPKQPLDGTQSMRDARSEDIGQVAAGSNTQLEDEVKMESMHALNGAIRDFLDQGIRRKPSSSRSNDEPGKKNRLFGRALSNVSNCSATSNVRQSRGGSVDSMNTDGMGSEIATMPSERHSGEVGSMSERGAFNFTGRAKTTMTTFKPQVVGMEDLDMAQGHVGREEEAPPMTQLGYEDPEEVILLREKLAQSRRKRTKLGQKEDDVTRTTGAAPRRTDRKIRDDDMLTGAGWGAGRRTRHKQRSPADDGLKEL